MRIRLFIIGLVLLVVGFGGAFYPILFKGTKDPNKIINMVFTLRFWFWAFVALIGMVFGYFSRES